MRFYVAGRTSDVRTVREMQHMLIERGHVISYDWTQHTEAVSRGDAHLTPDHMRHCSEVDHRGVRTADGVIVILRAGAKGTLVEIGAAQALGIPIWIFVMEDVGKCVFFHHNNTVVTYSFDEDPIDSMVDEVIEFESVTRVPHADIDHID